MKALEIGVFAGAAVAALAGAFAAASSFLGGDDEAATPRAQTEAAAPANTAEVRNSRYGFRFRYPNDWKPGPAPDPRVVEMVARGDMVLCMVLVQEQKLPSDVTGKPNNLSQILAMATPAAFGNIPLPGAKISSFEKTNLGGQEARFFTVDVAGQAKIEAHATLRSFGAIVLMCMAKSDIARNGDVRDAFKLARNSFSFD